MRCSYETRRKSSDTILDELECHLVMCFERSRSPRHLRREIRVGRDAVCVRCVLDRLHQFQIRVRPMIVDLECVWCGKKQQAELSVRAYREWCDGQLLQDVAPHLTPDEREMFISQSCSECFDGFLGED